MERDNRGESQHRSSGLDARHSLGTTGEERPAGKSTAINRTYTLGSTGFSTGSSTLRLHYIDGAELNGNDEGALELWHLDGGTTWVDKGATSRDTTNNWVELTGISAATLSGDWTLVSPATATLNVIKHVVNNNGGTATAQRVEPRRRLVERRDRDGNAAGAESPGTAYTLQVGKQYSVTESGGPSGYAASSSTDCTIPSAVSGTTYTCTITNDDQAPSLTLQKTVINNNGGSAPNTAWTLTATGTGGSPSNLSGTTPVSSGGTFKADTYTLAESGGPSGYLASVFTCTNGVTVTAAQITLANGQSTVCTITNDDIAPSLELDKTVTNDNGGPPMRRGR